MSTVVGDFLSADAADDGGGVVVRDTPTRNPPLGLRHHRPDRVPGLGGPPGGAPCRRRRGGGSEAPGRPAPSRPPAHGPASSNAKTGSVKVSEGPFRLNGLVIVPDANVQVQIDPSAKTIRSTGTVSVLLRAPGVPDITLFRGVLDLDATGKGAGAALGTFTERLFKPVMLGFPLRGDIDFKLAPRTASASR